MPLPNEARSSKPVSRVTSARITTPKKETNEPKAPTTGDKTKRAEVIPKLTTVAALTQHASAIPLRAKKDFLHSVTNFQFERVLGQGAYAVVKLAWDKIRAQKVAVKIYDKNIVSDPRKMKNVRREIALLKEMDHPHVIKLLDSFDTLKQVSALIGIQA